MAQLPIALLVEKHRPQDDRWPGIVFDVTETQVLTKTALLKSRIPGLHQAGVSLAIDNFGRGNSSFEVFKELPFSEIKIDQSVRPVLRSRPGQCQSRKSVIDLAHNFGSTASAVGVETREDSQELVGLGCDIGQGYLFARPMTDKT